MYAHRLLSERAAADFLGLTTHKLNRLVRDDRIPHIVLPGGEIRFDSADLWEWLKTRKRSARDGISAETTALPTTITS